MRFLPDLLGAATMFGFAGADEGAAVLFETDAGILGKAFRIGMQSAQEACDFSAHIFVAGRSLIY